MGVVSIQAGQQDGKSRCSWTATILNRYRISASQVATRIGLNGMNVPVGKVELGGRELLFRSVGEYDDLDRIRQDLGQFHRVRRVGARGQPGEGRGHGGGRPQVQLHQRQTRPDPPGLQAIQGQHGRGGGWVPETHRKINECLKARPGAPHLDMFQDMARPIRMNLEDVQVHHPPGHLPDHPGGLAFPGQFPFHPHHHHGPARVAFRRLLPHERRRGSP